MLMDRVLWDVHEVARREVPPRRLLGNVRVVLVSDLRLDVPVEAVPAALHDVDGFVGHVPVLRALPTRRDLLLIDVYAVRPHLGALGRRDDADAPVARVLPTRVALLDDLLALCRAGRPELGPILARAESLRLERAAASLLPEAHRHPVRLGLQDQGKRADILVGVVVL